MEISTFQIIKDLLLFYLKQVALKINNCKIAIVNASLYSILKDLVVFALIAMIQQEEIATVMMDHIMVKITFVLTALSCVLLALMVEDSIVMSIVHGFMYSLLFLFLLLLVLDCL